MAFHAISLVPLKLDADSMAPARRPCRRRYCARDQWQTTQIDDKDLAFIRHLIRHQRKRIAAAIYGESRLFPWLVARDFTGKSTKKRSMLQPLLPGPHVGLEPQEDDHLTGTYMIPLG